jgi:hypothetical protein
MGKRSGSGIFSFQQQIHFEYPGGETVKVKTAGICLLMMISGGSFVRANSWPATDGLGRTLPEFKEAGPLRTNRTVALFYFLWQYQHSKTGPHDISRILAEHPGARTNADDPAWGPVNAYHHFAEPLFGYYRSTDEWVYRKHAEMLADTGVDVIIFDASNGLTYKECHRTLCRVFDQAQKDGVNVPKIAFLCRFGPVDPAEIETLYRDLYEPGLYENLWFRWKGKPLIMAYPEGVPENIRKFFTFRAPMPTYFDPPAREDHWSWLQRYPQHAFGGTAEQPEQMAVGVAMNALTNKITALSDPRSMGRSYHKGQPDPRPEAYRYGLNFQEQWNRALEADPELIFVTGWNEWVAMRMGKFADYQAPVVFVDLFDVEHSRDIEPMKGGYGDNYYYQLVSNIRKFKGMGQPDTSGAYTDYRGDTLHRDCPGWGGELHYVNRQGRNDIISARVTRDGKTVRFRVETAAPLTKPEGDSWMLLLIDIDRDHSTGWEGYDFILNRLGPGSLEKNTGGWQWEPIGTCDVKTGESELTLSVSREALTQEGRTLDFEFKWVDNLNRPGDIMDFYTCGDAAPGERFNYRFCE